MSMLLCDFHIHTTWSDGSVDLPEVVDIYGQAGFDVISITDHVYNSDSTIGSWAERLNKTIAGAGYFAELFTNPVGLSLLMAAAAPGDAEAWTIVGGVAAAKMAMDYGMHRTLRITRGSRLVPVDEAPAMEPAAEAMR